MCFLYTNCACLGQTHVSMPMILWLHIIWAQHNLCTKSTFCYICCVWMQLTIIICHHFNLHRFLKFTTIIYNMEFHQIKNGFICINCWFAVTEFAMPAIVFVLFKDLHEILAITIDSTYIFNYRVSFKFLKHIIWM